LQLVRTGSGIAANYLRLVFPALVLVAPGFAMAEKAGWETKAIKEIELPAKASPQVQGDAGGGENA
jgi:hypothetical protein